MAIGLSYHLIRSKKRRRTVSLQIKEDGKIVIMAPFHTPKWEIERFIRGKQWWIVEKISEKEKQAKEAKKMYLPGEKFLYLGEWYPLEIHESNHKEAPLRLSFGNFILNKDRIEEARDLFVEWYKKEAEEKIAERVNYYNRSVHLFPKGIRITGAKSRWGSCSRDNRLSFSWRIIMASLATIDYVLIHELVHIREKNHSKKFWTTLESILPDYRKHRLWLRENAHLLEL
ncbi:MAG TPA: SprT family zinc-dependent metalloprotease [Thermodesulfobacteriota bacterium]|nr:SprT family zinc-dependent metalloprotease [Thermodesulfobacteriota bacterium]